MNVVLLPALASVLGLVLSDGFLCNEAGCLMCWAWTFAALTLVSAWCVQCWSGRDDLAQLAPVPVAHVAKPQAAGIVSLTHALPVRSHAAPGASWHGLRAPPINSMLSLFSPRSAGTPMSPALPGSLG